MDTLAVDPLAILLAMDDEERYEWAEGSLVSMSPPSSEHGRQMLFLVEIMDLFAQKNGLGQVMPDGLAMRLEKGTIRVPDASYFKKQNVGRIRATYSEGPADLIVEIVSKDSRVRDTEKKRREYERAGVEEYWIVDPDLRQATFYRLQEGSFRLVEPDAEGKVHASTMPGFFIRIDWLWNRPVVFDALRELGVL